MIWIVIGLSLVSMAGIFFMIRYFLLTNNIKHMALQLREIEQNPENNRILLLSYFDKNVEMFCKIMNEYICTNQKLRIYHENREKKLRMQIESISHDLRTPLTAMLGYLSFVNQETLDEESKEALEVVERKAAGLQSLICNFYDLSRLEMEDYHISMERIDIARLLQETILGSYQELEQSGLQVMVEAGEEQVFILGDTGAMERIFHNMIQNAIRYSESYFKVTVLQEDNQVKLLFENDTHTLKKEDLPHIFERFYVKDKSRTKMGTGLGLTIGKLLTEAMGGSVEAKLTEQRFKVIFSFHLLAPFA